ncbi:hypothetical protein D4M43_23560 [Escherichia coli]|nr:hypothetical protein D4M43_23560 [Escherichia coli]
MEYQPIGQFSAMVSMQISTMEQAKILVVVLMIDILEQEASIPETDLKIMFRVLRILVRLQESISF